MFAKVLKSYHKQTPLKKTQQVAKAMVLRKIIKKSEKVEQAGGLANALGTPNCN